jgi:hypothetical protein
MSFLSHIPLTFNRTITITYEHGLTFQGSQVVLGSKFQFFAQYLEEYPGTTACRLPSIDSYGVELLKLAHGDIPQLDLNFVPPDLDPSFTRVVRKRGKRAAVSAHTRERTIELSPSDKTRNIFRYLTMGRYLGLSTGFLVQLSTCLTADDPVLILEYFHLIEHHDNIIMGFDIEGDLVPKIIEYFEAGGVISDQLLLKLPFNHNFKIRTKLVHLFEKRGLRNLSAEDFEKQPTQWDFRDGPPRFESNHHFMRTYLEFTALTPKIEDYVFGVSTTHGLCPKYAAGHSLYCFSEEDLLSGTSYFCDHLISQHAIVPAAALAQYQLTKTPGSGRTYLSAQGVKYYVCYAHSHKSTEIEEIMYFERETLTNIGPTEQYQAEIRAKLHPNLFCGASNRESWSDSEIPVEQASAASAQSLDSSSFVEDASPRLDQRVNLPEEYSSMYFGSQENLDAIREKVLALFPDQMWCFNLIVYSIIFQNNNIYFFRNYHKYVYTNRDLEECREITRMFRDETLWNSLQKWFLCSSVEENEYDAEIEREQDYQEWVASGCG